MCCILFLFILKLGIILCMVLVYCLFKRWKIWYFFIFKNVKKYKIIIYKNKKRRISFKNMNF